jgi:hypothetical protein
MKYTPSLISVLFLFLIACQSQPGSQGDKKKEPVDNSWNVLDREYQTYIDTLVNRQRNQVGFKQAVRYPAFGSKFTPKDSISYQIYEGEWVYAMAMIESSQAIKWLEYHLNEGEPMYIRHRAWYKDLLWGYAEETIIYLKDGEISFAMDRMLRIDSRYSNAGGLRFMNYKASREPKELLQKKIDQHWPYIKETVQKAMAQRGQ